MKQDSSPHTSLIVRSQRPVAERATRPVFSKDSLDKKLQGLQVKASGGDHQSHIRLEAIHRLVDPCLQFCASDVKRILSKGYPPQVEKGLEIYRLMRRLKLFCEPVGKTVGAACRVKLINFKELTFSSLLDIKAAHDLVRRASERNNRNEKFDGMALLKPEEKALYLRLRPYFGGKKRPTLKSLAVSLLGEGNEIFTDRTATNYLAAVRSFKIEHKEDLDFTWGSTWSVVGVIDAYNLNETTGRETASRIVINLAEVSKGIGFQYETGFQRMMEDFGKGIRESLMPKPFLDGFGIAGETTNAFAEYERRTAEAFRNAVSPVFQQQAILGNHFNSLLEGFRTIGESMTALAANSPLEVESRLSAFTAGFPMQEGFAKYFPDRPFGQETK